MRRFVGALLSAFGIALLLLVTFPFWMPIAITLFAILLTIFATILTLIVSTWFVWIILIPVAIIALGLRLLGYATADDEDEDDDYDDYEDDF